ncbi:MAG: MBL fold metallo-hydrolase [Ignavibacteria bacterium]|jgi:L-ascorbate metabolism protein UlaG (beta-lactamase superfamily)
MIINKNVNKVLLVICYLQFVICISGCFYASIAIRNFDDAIFDSAKKVENKIKDPVKKDIRLSALWGGHSTILLQMYNKVIIFDPYFNNHLGGVFLRKVETGLDVDYLNQLDLICVSHSHMDHLCYSSIGVLSEKFPNAKLVFPYGVEKYLPAFDVDMVRIDNRNVNPNKIGKTILIDSIMVTPVYVAHTGGRYAIDTYTWKVEGATGYILQYRDLCIYFAGDTGYDSTAFKKIGNNFKIDLAFIPIGPCRNCDSLGFRQHTSSSEGLLLFRDLNAKYMIPMHYGAIRYMSDENYPLVVLEELLNTTAYGDLKNKVKILKVGEQIIFNE